MKTLSLLISLAFPAFLFSQSSHPEFPGAWVGKWSGNLEIYNPSGKIQEIPMELHILPIDTMPGNWTWTLLYGENARAYQLVEINRAAGVYLIDEKNTISMEGYYLAGTFYQFFEVMDNRLLTTVSLLADNLIWEIAVSKIEPVSRTGNQEVEGEQIPEVLTYPVTGIQRAKLSRLETKD